jgi:hypothetical protein
MRFQILKALSMKTNVFWDVAPRSLVEAAPIIALMMEAASIFETSVNFYQTIRRNTPQDNYLQEETTFEYNPHRVHK